MVTHVHAWKDRAACKGMDTEIFFPPDGMRGKPRDELEVQAAAACRRCPVSLECLIWAMGDTETGRPMERGFWGGTTEEQRMTLARKRRRRQLAEARKAS